MKGLLLPPESEVEVIESVPFACLSVYLCVCQLVRVYCLPNVYSFNPSFMSLPGPPTGAIISATPGL